MSVETLPKSWAESSIGDCCALNPKMDKSAVADSAIVHFVPMPAVEALTNRMNVSVTRAFSEVKKGYTPFASGDVIFAKITPCMENGKVAVVPELVHGIAFGSTEFHVLRPKQGVDPLWIFFLLSSRSFRSVAEHNMTGAVGQRRVPVDFLARSTIPLPPLAEQKRIVAKIEELFSELEAGEESLRVARRQLGVYRQSLLKHAFEGKLTAQWRTQNPDKLESPAQLLARIREAWNLLGIRATTPPHGILARSSNTLPAIPSQWHWLQLESIAVIGTGMSVSQARKYENPIEVPYLRVANVQRGHIDLSEMRTMLVERSRLASLQLKPGDILFNEGGDRDKLGRGWVWNGELDPCITQNHVFRATVVSSSIVVPQFVSHWGNAFGQDFFHLTGKQTTNLASISKAALSSLPVPVAPLEEQKEILRLLDDQFDVIDLNEREIDAALQRSEALRQSILKEAFTGRLVPQNPSDEPASQLLARLRAHVGAPAEATGRRKRGSPSASSV